MPDQTRPGRSATSETIAILAARAALQTPGVLRLEPTLDGLLSCLAPAGRQHPLHSGAPTGTCPHDGVTATVTDGTAHLTVDIAVEIACTALDVAAAVRGRLREEVGRAGLVAGRVDIRILAIEARPRVRPRTPPHR